MQVLYNLIDFGVKLRHSSTNSSQQSIDLKILKEYISNFNFLLQIRDIILSLYDIKFR